MLNRGLESRARLNRERGEERRALWRELIYEGRDGTAFAGQLAR